MTLDDVKTRVLKLLRLARDKGATEAEATLAAEKAQALLEEHKLAQADCIDVTEARETTGHDMIKVQLRCPHWRRVLRKACADTSYCFSMAGNAGEWHLFGKPTDIMVTRELYAFLAGQVERMGREYGRASTTRGAGIAFRVGCAARVATRLREAFKARQVAHTQSHALVLYDDAQAARALSRSVFPYQRQTTSAGVRDQGAYSAGMRAGDGVRLTVERPISASTCLRIAGRVA